MNFFLASRFSTVSSLLPPLLPKPISELCVAYIPDARLDYSESRTDSNLESLSTLGAKIEKFTLRSTSHSDLKKILRFDMLFVTGGSIFSLIQSVHSSNFTPFLNEFLERGGWYAGSSAGSMILASHLERVVSLEKEIGSYASPLEGCGVLPFLILPHAQKNEYRKFYDQLLEKPDQAYVPLRDDQVIVIRGSERLLLP